MKALTFAFVILSAPFLHAAINNVNPNEGLPLNTETTAATGVTSEGTTKGDAGLLGIFHQETMGHSTGSPAPEGQTQQPETSTGGVGRQFGRWSEDQNGMFPYNRSASLMAKLTAPVNVTGNGIIHIGNGTAEDLMTFLNSSNVADENENGSNHILVQLAHVLAEAENATFNAIRSFVPLGGTVSDMVRPMVDAILNPNPQQCKMTTDPRPDNEVQLLRK